MNRVWEHPKFIRLVVQCGVGLVLLLGLVLFFALFLHRDRERKMKAILGLASQVEELKSFSRDIVDVEEEIVKIQSAILQYEERFRLQGEMPKVIQSLSALFNAHHLKTMSIFPKGVSTMGGGSLELVKNTLAVDLEGRYQDLGELMMDLESQKDAVIVEGLEISKVGENSEELAFKVLISVFLKKSEGA